MKFTAKHVKWADLTSVFDVPSEFFEPPTSSHQQAAQIAKWEFTATVPIIRYQALLLTLGLWSWKQYIEWVYPQAKMSRWN